MQTCFSGSATNGNLSLTTTVLGVNVLVSQQKDSIFVAICTPGIAFHFPTLSISQLLPCQYGPIVLIPPPASTQKLTGCKTSLQLCFFNNFDVQCLLAAFELRASSHHATHRNAKKCSKATSTTPSAENSGTTTTAAVSSASASIPRALVKL